ncbi:MAG: hypothetical protein CM15mP38_0040 [Synechococcus sp.]|nr:MAG: hypothetical protein CM15mP38_0040 [Synechococcus sp.]
MRSYSSVYLSLFSGIKTRYLRELINGEDASGKFARIMPVKCPLKPLELKDDPIGARGAGEAFRRAERVLAFYAVCCTSCRPVGIDSLQRLAAISTAGFAPTSWRR